LAHTTHANGNALLNQVTNKRKIHTGKITDSTAGDTGTRKNERAM
jgi:hypothetical protein